MNDFNESRLKESAEPDSFFVPWLHPKQGNIITVHSICTLQDDRKVKRQLSSI